MKAMLLEKPAPIDTAPLHMAELPDPEPGRGEILVKVAACGVCRSNLHMIEGDWVRNGVPAKLPIIPGHEIVGRVAAVGDGVEGLAIGARVGVQPLWTSCERCEYCLTGREQLCPYKEITGETVDGGYAEYLVAKERHVYMVPDSVSDAEGAPLFCPGITAFGAVSKARLAPGRTLALYGFGGVGHMVQQFAQLAGAEVTVVARSAGHLALAKKLGAVAHDRHLEGRRGRTAPQERRRRRGDRLRTLDGAAEGGHPRDEARRRDRRGRAGGRGRAAVRRGEDGGRVTARLAPADARALAVGGRGEGPRGRGDASARTCGRSAEAHEAR